MMKKIAHIGIAVRDMDTSIDLFKKLLGKSPDHSEKVDDQKIQTAMFQIGESALELTQATDPSSPIARFIEKRGEGVHHISFVVDNIHSEIDRLKSLGFTMVDEEPKLGADGYLVAFLHPKSTNGVLVELSQKNP